MLDLVDFEYTCFYFIFLFFSDPRSGICTSPWGFYAGFLERNGHHCRHLCPHFFLPYHSVSISFVSTKPSHYGLSKKYKYKLQILHTTKLPRALKKPQNNFL